MAKPILIVGASHQGEVVIDLLRCGAASAEVLGFIDCGLEGRFVGKLVSGLPVLDSLANVQRYRAQVAGAVPAVGDCREREGIAAALAEAEIPLLGAVHESAIIAHDVTLGDGAVVHAGAILGVRTRIGRAAIVNSGALVEHHGHIGDFAHVAPGSRLAGGVRVGERAWIGIGATVMEDLAIGPDAIIGAGAVVTRDVAEGVTVVGVPARPHATTQHGRESLVQEGNPA